MERYGVTSLKGRRIGGKGTLQNREGWGLYNNSEQSFFFLCNRCERFYSDPLANSGKKVTRPSESSLRRGPSISAGMKCCPLVTYAELYAGKQREC